MKFLFVGDVFGSCGMNIISSVLPELIREQEADLTIVNAENASGGNGLSYADYDLLVNSGADVITMGNHTFGRKDIFKILTEESNIIRPANYPQGTVGRGSVTVERKGKKIGVVNLLGRTNIMMNLDCPFRAAEREISVMKGNADIIIVDFHADATSEKRAMGFFLDGKVTCVFGTHTHVQTADETLLPRGTAYISDIGMTGAELSVLGVSPESAIARFVTAMPQKFEHASGKSRLCGALLTVDDNTCRAVELKRIVKY